MRQLTTGPSAQPARCSAQTDKRVILPSYSNRNPRQTSLRCFSSTFPFKLPHSTKVASSRPVVDTLRPLQSSAQHSIGDGYPLGNPTPSLIPGLMPTPYAASHSPRSRLQPVACSAGTDVAISEATDNVLRVYYLRRDKQYKGWGLHIWGDVQQETAWTRAMEPTGFTGDAVYFDVPLSSAKGTVGLLVHRGDEKAAGGMVYRVSSKAERWLFDSEVSLLDEAPDLNNLPVGNLLKSYCHWVDTRSLVWRVAPFNEQGNPKVFQLHFKKDAGLKLAGEGIQGADLVIPLEFSSSQLEPKTVSKFPHLQGCVTLKLPEQYVDQIPELVKGQLAVSMLGQDGTILDNTGVQIPGLLDDLFYYHGPLGDVIDADQGHVIRVWAPTAQNVELLHWKELRGGEPSVHPMTASGQGVWSFQRPAEWTGQCYKYRITAFCPWNTQVEMMETTDPYARCTTANGERTLMVDLHNPDLLPAGWNQHTSPPLTNWTDVSVYELHIRDFSSNDPTVPAPLQGRYLAFSPEHVTAQGGDLSNGLKHLQRLRAAGMNHIHLLPTYDYGSVPERPEEQMVVEEDLSKYPPNSEVPQTVIASICDNDAFNWGYDPVHYGVPEGSYSTNPDGSERVLEFRQMVKGLHDMGFRVVLDVVYNHTFRSGPSDALSVLDKVVPGYYHRRGEDGSLMNSTCCNNTASEHLMCEKFIVDDAVHWAKTYKIPQRTPAAADASQSYQAMARQRAAVLCAALPRLHASSHGHLGQPCRASQQYLWARTLYSALPVFKSRLQGVYTRSSSSSSSLNGGASGSGNRNALSSGWLYSAGPCRDGRGRNDVKVKAASSAGVPPDSGDASSADKRAPTFSSSAAPAAASSLSSAQAASSESAAPPTAVDGESAATKSSSSSSVVAPDSGGASPGQSATAKASKSGVWAMVENWNKRSAELNQKLRSLGIAGVVAYGMLNTVYYTCAFLFFWMYVVKVPPGLGVAGAAARFVEVFGLVWAGSQVTKLARAAGAVVLAPIADAVLGKVMDKLKLKSKQQAFLVLVGGCILGALSIFGLTVMAYA